MVGKKSCKTCISKFIENNENLVVFSILLLGLFLRLSHIVDREITYDDAFSYFLASNGFLKIIQGTVADTMPPLYYFLLHFFIMINEELWFLRTLNVVINLASIFILFLVVKELFNKRAGYVTIFLAIGSPFLIYHSQELRMYSLLLFGQIGYLYSIIKISKFDSKHKFYIFSAVVFGIIALYAHNLAIVGVVACNFVFFMQKSKRFFKNLVLIQFFLLLLFSPWLYFLPQQITKVQSAFWTNRPGIIELFQSILTLFGFAPLEFWKMAFVILIIFQNLIIAFVWMIKTKNLKMIRFSLIGLFIPFALFLISYIAIPVFVPRIFILSTFIAYAIMGVFINSNWNFAIGKISFLSLIFVVLFSLPNYYKFESFPRSPFKETIEFLTEKNQGEKFILHDNKLSYFPMKFYDNKFDQYFIADPNGSENDTLAYQSQLALGHYAIQDISNFDLPQELFFIVFKQTELEYETLNLENPNFYYLRTFYQDYSLYQSVGDINIYYFSKKL